MARQQAEFTGDQESEEGELVLQGLCSCCAVAVPGPRPQAPVILPPQHPHWVVASVSLPCPPRCTICREGG